MVHTRRSLRIQQRTASESEASDINTDDESNISSSARKAKRKSTPGKTTTQKVRSLEGIPPTVDECIEEKENGENDTEVENDDATPIEKQLPVEKVQTKEAAVKQKISEVQNQENLNCKDENFDITKSFTNESQVKKASPKKSLKSKTPKRKAKIDNDNVKDEIVITENIEKKVDSFENDITVIDIEQNEPNQIGIKTSNDRAQPVIEECKVIDKPNEVKTKQTDKKTNNPEDFIHIATNELGDFLKGNFGFSDSDDEQEEDAKDSKVQKETVYNFSNELHTNNGSIDRILSKPKFVLDYRKYDTNKNKNKKTSLGMLGSKLRSNLQLQNHLKKLKNPNLDTLPSSIADNFALDGAKMTDDLQEPSIETKLSDKALPLKVSIKQAANEEVKNLMKKSVLPSDMEKEKNCPKFFVNKNKMIREKKKKNDETAGAGWYNLPRTEITDEIKKDLQIIKMRSTLDTKHHYKRSDQKSFPKYFQMGTIVEGAHEYYSSRISKKERKRTMVDELLSDAEFRKKNKKRMIEYEMRKGSGGKSYYKKKMEKRKANLIKK